MINPVRLLNDQIKILVCPLDWGIGHASRMIPLIHKLLQSNFEVILASYGKAGELLKTEFPNLCFIDLPSYTIRYSRSKSQVFIMILQLHKILAGIIKEHRWLKRIVSMHHIDIVISDNRYGLCYKKILSVFISHQISPSLPSGLKWIEPFVYVFLGIFIRSFDRCWIPDIEDPSTNLTGKLSHRYKIFHNASFMGMLSRFNENHCMSDGKTAETYDIMVILSGPEPQRTLLEEMLVRQLGETVYKAAIVCGLQQPVIQNFNRFLGSVDFFYHLPVKEFRNMLLNSGVIICRSGYSTIMDLVELGRPAILIPTPGQPEQEYLAGYLSQKGFFCTMNQQSFDLQKALRLFQSKRFNRAALSVTNTEKYLQDLLNLYQQKKKNRR